MKTFIFLCCLVTIAIATPTTLQLYSKWNEFKLAHSKTYVTPTEEKKRMEIFAENVKMIEEHNKRYEQGLTTYKMAVNKFADWSHDEFVQFLTKHNRTQHKSLYTFQEPLNVQLPTSVDWREKGAVTGVKDQGECGGCWAFSATGSMEGQSALRKGKLVSLSEQELIDCSTANGNEGCDGGLMDYAFEYVEKNGVTTEQEYPFEGIDNRCRRSGKSIAVRTSGYVDIPTGSESSLLSAVATVGPVSIAVDASYWSFYSEGIYTGHCGKSIDSLDHGVLAVGYTEDYWIVKNSWGDYWGEDGYIRLPRNKNACGIATEASYPLLA